MSLVLKRLEMHGFKSFAKKVSFEFPGSVTAIVGPNGSGKSNVVEAIRFVLGEQSTKSLRSKTGSDLIFKGSAKIPHMNRASVSITFDNTKRLFQLPALSESGGPNLDFDEVTISREVVADGAQRYSINGTDVRMKDIHELIAGVNIGTSGHHIISQGEADRILNAKPVERREMLEESLGLRLYHYRIREAQKKLEKTRLHIIEAESIRRELAPHIKFLKKQVEKIQGAELLRTELESAYHTYLVQEGSYIAHVRAQTADAMAVVTSDIAAIDADIAGLHSDTEYQTLVAESESQIADIRTRVRTLSVARDEHVRMLSRIEGMLEMMDIPAAVPTKRTETISRDAFDRSVDQVIHDLKNISSSDIADFITRAVDLISTWRTSVWTRADAPQTLPVDTGTSDKRDGLLADQATQSAGLERVTVDLAVVESELQTAQKNLDDIHHRFRDQEFVRRSHTERRYERQRELDNLERESVHINERRTALESEYADAIALIGSHMVGIKSETVPMDQIQPHDSLRALHTSIGRMKIRLEESGAGGGMETVTEYDETVARDAHLASEIADVENTIRELTTTVDDLQGRLSADFATGLARINTQFRHYFDLMFGGGSASLSVVEIDKRKRKSSDEEIEMPEITDEDEVREIGVDIDVNLPRKKVKDLDMLSGGERSLTSIALLFALSQVNPPPFLVLDETDAALDEANSRKYGDMIESLAQHTQLVVVTHNRETMSRANILFGVTLGMDDASTVLSVSFDEAGAYAK